MTAYLKQKKTKKNKQNVNKVHKTIQNYKYHQLLTSKNDVRIALRNMCQEDTSVISNLTNPST